MNIQQKILQFRKDKRMQKTRINSLVYLVSKDEAIEFAKFISGNPHIQTFYDPDFCVEVAGDGDFNRGLGGRVPEH